MGYAFGYVKPAVVAASPVASYAAPVAYTKTYAADIPFGLHHLGKREAEADSQYIYNTGVYNNGYNGYIPKVYNGIYNTYAGVHHLGKRDAEADSQYFYSAGVYNNGYNGYIPKVYNNVASPVYNGIYNSVYNGVYNGLYNTYSGVHHIGKREAEADSQWLFNNGYTPYAGYTGYSGLTGYATPYNYGNVWNRAQYMW